MLSQDTIQRFQHLVMTIIKVDDECLIDLVGVICQKVNHDLQTLLTYDANVRKAVITLRDCHERFSRGQLPESDWYLISIACHALITAVATDGWVEGYTHALGGTARQTN